MASMTQAEDTPHNIRAKERFVIFNDPTQPESRRQKARDEFFFDFEHLAYYYARQILPRWDENDKEDIQQTAAYALCRARDMWNPDRGPFAVILMYAVRNDIRDWLRQRDLIVRSHRTFHAHAQQVRQGVDTSMTERIRVVSLDAPYEAKNSSDDQDKLPLDPCDPKSKVDQDSIELAIAVRQVVDRLPVSERAIVINYYGMDGNEPRTLRDTANIVGRSHETVRKALVRAQRTMCGSLHGYA